MKRKLTVAFMYCFMVNEDILSRYVLVLYYSVWLFKE